MMEREFETRLQRYLDGQLESAERAAFEEEVLADGAAVDDLMDELALRELLARRRARSRGRRMRPGRAIAALAAVAAAVALVVWMRPTTEPVFRGDTEQVLVEPRGSIDEAPTRFVWRRVKGARIYRLEIFSASEVRLRREDVADTTWSIPAGFVPPDQGRWSVTALDDVGLAVGEAHHSGYEIRR